MIKKYKVFKTEGKINRVEKKQESPNSQEIHVSILHLISTPIAQPVRAMIPISIGPYPVSTPTMPPRQRTARRWMRYSAGGPVPCRRTRYWPGYRGRSWRRRRGGGKSWHRGGGRSMGWRMREVPSGGGPYGYGGRELLALSPRRREVLAP